MAKKERWLLRFAADIDGGLTTANEAHEEHAAIKKALEDAGYHVFEYQGFCAPMAPGDERRATT